MLHYNKISKTLLYSFIALCLPLTCTPTKASEKNLPQVQRVSFPKDTINIKDFGAKNDGQTLNTSAINKAISAIHKRGGGVVTVPEGIWLTGPLKLQSNVNLHVKQSAVILFTDDFNEYKLEQSNWEGEPAWRNESPISGKNLENIAITGAGVIDGNGGAWRMVKKFKMTNAQWAKLIKSGGVVDEKNDIWYPSESAYKGSKTNNAGRAAEGQKAEDFLDVKDFLRPNLLSLVSCNKILLEGVTFQNSPGWNVHPLLCENLTVRGVNIRNPWYAQNGDGLDIESCSNVLVENSSFDVGDDAICIKSGRDESGRKRGVPTQNVWIRNNTVFHGHGGFVIGSEMSGGAKNIWIENCVFLGTDIGLRFKTTRGRGGIVENIFIDNINMIDIPGEAILFDMYYGIKGDLPKAGEQANTNYELPPVTEETPRFQNFSISNITVNGAKKGVFIRGLPEMPIKDIRIENINIVAEEGIELIKTDNLTMKNIKIQVRKSNPLISLDNSRNIRFDSLTPTKPIETLVLVSGEETENIKFTINQTQEVKKLSKFIHGAAKDQLQIN